MVLQLVLRPAQFLCGRAVRHHIATKALKPVLWPLLIGALRLLSVLPAPRGPTSSSPPAHTRGSTPATRATKATSNGIPPHGRAHTPRHRLSAAHIPRCSVNSRTFRHQTTAALTPSALYLPPTSILPALTHIPLLHFSIPGSPLLSWLGSYILVGAGTSWVVRTVKRNVRRNRARRRMMSAGPVNELSVVTFNIRGIMDRWRERAPLLRECIRELDADVLGFQEVLTGEFQQDLQLVGEGYRIHECRAALANMLQAGGALRLVAQLMSAMLQLGMLRSMMVGAPVPLEAYREARNLSGSFFRNIRDLTIAPFYGNSFATRLPTAAPTTPADTLVLGSFRAAQRICLLLPQGPPAGPPAGPTDTPANTPAAPLALWVVNTHLDHAGEATRQAQAEAICRWMEGVKRRQGVVGVVVMGDLNAPVEEGVHAAMVRHGYMSAHKVVHGHEPKVTWPTGLVAPLMDTGDPHCADYVYVYEAPGHTCRPTAVQLAGTRPDPADPTLYPSDHAALRVTLRVGPPAAVNAATGT